MSKEKLSIRLHVHARDYEESTRLLNEIKFLKFSCKYNLLKYIQNAQFQECLNSKHTYPFVVTSCKMKHFKMARKASFEVHISAQYNDIVLPKCFIGASLTSELYRFLNTQIDKITFYYISRLNMTSVYFR